MIEVKNLSYAYRKERQTLADINLKIRGGETVAITGRTGSGKSTLIQMLNGLLRPDSGQVIIDGEDIRGKKVKDICKKVGIVFQYPESQLFEETVREDIAFGPRNLGLSEAEIEERVAEASEMVGLDTESLDKSPFELSGGQTRRAAIAGVIAMKPQILILDEPMAGLDPEGRDTVIKMIERLRQENITVIFVSHSMEDTARIADRIVVINKGRIEADGAVSDIFSQSGRLYDMGLRAPQAALIINGLRDRGFNLEQAYTVKSAAVQIKRLLAGEGDV